MDSTANASTSKVKIAVGGLTLDQCIKLTDSMRLSLNLLRETASEQQLLDIVGANNLTLWDGDRPGDFNSENSWFHELL
jgi:hypothetical protein